MSADTRSLFTDAALGSKNEERQAVLERLTSIAKRELADRSLSPGEAHTVIAWIGELQLFALEAVSKDVSRRRNLRTEVATGEGMIAGYPYGTVLELIYEARQAGRLR